MDVHNHTPGQVEVGARGTINEINMTIATAVFLGFYIPLTVQAHILLHYEHVKKNSVNSGGSLTCCGKMQRMRYTRNQPIQSFFPIFQSLVIVPLIEAFCVWRIHQTHVSRESTLLMWALVLLFGTICAVISVCWFSMRSYFAYVSTSIMFAPALIFIFEGSLRPDASGDIAAAVLLFVSCACQIIYPPGALADVDERSGERRVDELLAEDFGVLQPPPIPDGRDELEVEFVDGDSEQDDSYIDDLLPNQEEMNYNTKQMNDSGDEKTMPSKTFDAYPKNGSSKGKYDPWKLRDRVRNTARQATYSARRSMLRAQKDAEKRKSKETSEDRVNEHLMDLMSNAKEEITTLKRNHSPVLVPRNTPPQEEIDHGIYDNVNDYNREAYAQASAISSRSTAYSSSINSPQGPVYVLPPREMKLPPPPAPAAQQQQQDYI